MNITLDLPWPPSANSYWRRNGGRYFISKRGQDYREYVTKACYIYQGLFDSTMRLALSINAYPPDKRKRDLYNLAKGVLDSLQHANVFPDDNQIDKLTIERMPFYDGKIIVSIDIIQGV